MKTLDCDGLDGSNPLHFLAGLGLLNLFDRVDPGARLSWARKGGWRARLHLPTLDPEDVPAVASQWLTTLAKTESVGPEGSRKVRDLKAEYKKANEAAKEARKRATAEAKARKLKKEEAKALVEEATRAADKEAERLGKAVEEAQTEAAAANGAGVAHLGAIIGVAPPVARRAAEAAVQAWLSGWEPRAVQTDDPLLVARQLAGMMCDQVLEDRKVKPTPFSFSNGASSQELLKDFRALAARADQGRVKATLTGSGEHSEALTNLNWDPADQRSYALAWADPGKTGKETNVAANALAFLGMAMLPACPVAQGRKLTAQGWSTVVDGWVWPLWDVPLGHDDVASLLADAGLRANPPRTSGLKARGVTEVRLSRRINPTGKRSFFSPSTPV
jgi:hypothetical protein